MKYIIGGCVLFKQLFVKKCNKMSKQLKYNDIVKTKMAENPHHIGYDIICKDPICHTIVKALQPR